MFDSLLLKLHLILSVDSEENHGKGCHQRSDFMAKMHQIRFRRGSENPLLDKNLEDISHISRVI